MKDAARNFINSEFSQIDTIPIRPVMIQSS